MLNYLIAATPNKDSTITWSPHPVTDFEKIKNSLRPPSWAIQNEIFQIESLMSRLTSQSVLLFSNALTTSSPFPLLQLILTNLESEQYIPAWAAQCQLCCYVLLLLPRISKPFFILSDHRPLTCAPISSGRPYTPIELRRKPFISEFTHDIRLIQWFPNGSSSWQHRPTRR